MNNQTTPIKSRVSRSSRAEQRQDTRALMVRCGIEMFTERGFQASGIDEIRSRVGVPKGSFYHFFESKQTYGLVVIDAYAEYFERKLQQHFSNLSLSPLARLRSFTEDAKQGMQRFQFQRGCLIGNLGQELGGIDDVFRDRLEAVLQSWQRLTAACLRDAVAVGELPGSTECDNLAEFFWIGWEGAILRAKLTRNNDPLDRFFAVFLITAAGKQ
ncbi:TPA: TetR/AcrR family transcriptional regulator [Pseudomonas aeruginosa]|nr:TetR/AcrR family transcriptional regulator [Pseudomonas aeruginosa]